MRTVTYLATLMRYAQELGHARLSGDKERIVAATVAHDSYRDACLDSDDFVVTSGP